MSAIRQLLNAIRVAKDSGFSVVADLGSTGLTSGSCTVYMSKNGGAMASVPFSFVELGRNLYQITVSAGTNDTSGVAVVEVSGSSNQTYVSLQIETDAKTTGELYSDLDDGTLEVQDVGNIATGGITSGSFAGGAVDTNALAANAATEIATATWAYGTRTLSSFGTLIADIWSYSTRTLTSLGSGAIQAVWDALTSGLTTAGSIGKLLVDNIDTQLSAIQTDTSGIQAQTDKITFDSVETSAVKATISGGVSLSASDITAIGDEVADHATTTGGGDFKTCLRDAQGFAMGKTEMVNVDLVAGTGQMKLYAADNVTLIATFDVTFDTNNRPISRST